MATDNGVAAAGPATPPSSPPPSLPTQKQTGNAQLELSPEMEHLLGTILPIAIPAAEAIAQKIVQETVSKFEKSHPGHSIWEILGKAIASLLPNPQVGNRLLDRLHLTGFVAKISGFSKKLLNLVHNDPNLSSVRELAKKWDTAKITQVLGDGAAETAKEIRKAIFEAQPTGTIEGMVAANKINLSSKNSALKEDVLKVLSRLGPADMAIASPDAIIAQNPAILSDIPEDRQSSVTTEINKIARAQTLAPTPKALETLVKSELTTALSISSIPRSHFISAHTATMGDMQAAEVHANAARMTLSNHNLLTEMLSSTSQSGLRAIDGDGDSVARHVKVRDQLAKFGLNLNFGELFGATEQAADEQLTVYSPASYLVDLLMYLRNNNIDPLKVSANTSTAGDADSIKGTVLEKLLRRRPDLGNLELSPENTNTVLPIIDIANEIMESFIAHLTEYELDTKRPRQALIDVFNADDKDSEDLLSQPQNINSHAYRILASSVYPTNLPYHEPIDVQRAFLNFLGTSRANLVQTFRAKPPDLTNNAREVAQLRLGANSSTKDPENSPSVDDLMTTYQRRALDAQFWSETLGLVQEEFLILTKEVFWEKRYFEMVEGFKTDMTEAEYRKRIGLKATHELWGYQTEGEMLSDDSNSQKGLRFVKRQLLSRAGISFTDLIDVIQTRFVNHALSDSQKATFSKLHYSYRFLQKLVDVDSSSKYDRLARFLATNSQLVDMSTILGNSISNQLGVGSSVASPRGSTVTSPRLAPQDTFWEIRQWLSQHFLAFGKSIVLEAGQGPVLEITGQILAASASAISRELPQLPFDKIGILTPDGRLIDSNNTEYSLAVIGVLNSDGSIVGAEDKVIGQVNITGDVYYGSLLDNNNINEAFPTFSFSILKQGDNATGNWIISGGKLHKEDFVDVRWILDQNMGGGTQIDSVQLQHLDGTSLTVREWDRLHRFVRIWRKLEWSVQNTDRALIWKLTALQQPKDNDAKPETNGTLRPGDIEDVIDFTDFEEVKEEDPSDLGAASMMTDINVKTIEELASIKQILQICSLNVEQLLTFWTPMSTSGPNSQYRRLFFRRNIRRQNDVFEADDNGYYFLNSELKISDYYLEIMAVFSLKSTDLDFLLGIDPVNKPLNAVRVSDVINVDTLSQIYARCLLAQALSVRVTEISDIIGTLGNPFSTPRSCLAVLQGWQSINERSLPWNELRYVVDHQATARLDPLAMTQIESMKVSKTLKDNILNVQTTYPTVAEPSKQTIEFVQAVTTLVFEPARVADITGLLGGTTLYTVSAPDVVDPSFPKFDKESTLSKRVKYIRSKPSGPDQTTVPNAMLQVSGILSAEVTDELKAVFDQVGDEKGSTTGAINGLTSGTKPHQQNISDLKSAWIDSVDRLTKQPLNIFYDVLAGILPPALVESETTRGQEVLLAADISEKPAAKESTQINTTEQLEQGPADKESATAASSTSLAALNGTPPQAINLPKDNSRSVQPSSTRSRSSTEKVAFFLSYFMPYLQQRLIYNSVIETLASAAGFKDSSVARTLLENVISVGVDTAQLSPQDKSSMATRTNALETVLNSVKSDVDNWQGHISLPAGIESGTFVLYLPADVGQPKPFALVPLRPDERINSSMFSETSDQTNMSNRTDDVNDERQWLAFQKNSNDPLQQWYSQKLELSSSKKYALKIPKTLRKVLKCQPLSAIPSNNVDLVFSAWWKGYLCINTSDVYSFSVTSKNKPEAIILNNTVMQFSLKQQDPQRIWSTGPSRNRLDATKPHALELSGVLPEDLTWKSDNIARTKIPASYFLSEIAPAQIHTILTKLQKMALLLNNFELTPAEILHIHANSADFDGLDFDGMDNMKQWKRLNDYITLRDGLPKNVETPLTNLFGWASLNAEASRTEIAAQVELYTGWRQSQVEQILTRANFSTGSSREFRNEVILFRLVSLVKMSQQLGITIPQLFTWAKPLGTVGRDFLKYTVASHEIQMIARSRFQPDNWAKAVRPINDKLRENRKQALISYLLAQQNFTRENEILDADSLFDFFLIDVQMTPLVQTSRMVQATSSVQLFIQRCLLGLEEKRGVTPDALSRQRWEWMQKYRVWEANRKVYLYPENWIDPSLRDDKTEFYKQLESSLLQKELSEEVIATALKSYLYSIDSIANMEAVGLFVDYADGQKIHVFARTRSTPFMYYYNWYQPGPGSTGFWNGWTNMNIEIPHTINPATGSPGSYVSPIVFRRRLFLFVPEMIQRTVANDPAQTKKSDNQVATTFDDFRSVKLADALPKQAWEIKMSWTELRDGKWTPRQTCPYAFRDLPGTSVSQYIFAPTIVLDSEDSTDDNLPSAVKIYMNKTEEQSVEDTLRLGVLDPNEVVRRLVKSIFSGSVKLPTTTVTKTVSVGWSFNGTQLTPFVKSDLEPSAGSEDITKVTANFQVSPATSDKIASMSSLQAFERPISGKSTRSLKLRRPGPYIEDADLFEQETIVEDASKILRSGGPSIALTIGTDGSKQSQRFYHNFIHNLVRQVNDVDGITKAFETLGAVGVDDSGTVEGLTQDFMDAFGGSVLSQEDGESAGVTFNERANVYSIYNWEFGLHAPLTLMNRLFKDQQFEKALKVCHQIFDPLAKGSGKDTRRFWKFPPFKAIAQAPVETFFLKLKARQANLEINQWRENPFQPHVVARGRPQAYMKWIVMTYIKILIAWGDSLFKQNTLESIPQAIQLYILASNLYGPRGNVVPKRGKVKYETFNGLSTKFDAFSNAMVKLEEAFPFSNQTPLSVGVLPDGDVELPNILGFAGTLYFSIPDNPDLRDLASTIDDRLFKIRNSQDINGKFRVLPLFAPPIDPGLLVRAAAQGLSLNSVLQDLQGPLPNCKFQYVLGKSFELVSEVRSLGGALLSAFEKKDGEKMSTLRQRHELAMQTLLMESKMLALEEAKQSLEILEYNRTGAVGRLTHYFRLVGNQMSGIPDLDREFQELDARIDAPIDNGGLGLSPYENEEMDKNAKVVDINYALSAITMACGIIDILPNFNFNAQPMGLGATTVFGPENISKMMQQTAKGIGIGAEVLGNQANAAGRRGVHQRALQDRVLQANTAGYEVSSIDKQITAAKIRIAMANKDVDTQQRQIDQTTEMSDFLRDKYTNEELYSWMESSLKTLYYQTYSEAFALAKRAEKAFKYESPQTSVQSKTYIQAGYWDSNRDGLLSGEALFLDLKRMEAARLDVQPHDFEISKNVSLRMIRPLELMTLRETGKCEFSIPEILFDLDFPGHYLRRIKSVSLTIPCIVGPYTSINATLSLLSSEYRVSSSVSPRYEKSIDASSGFSDDTRFSTVLSPITSIAVTSGQNDTGVFQLDFSDGMNRYLPFEGAGAISTWRLTLPEIKQFDYDTIYDVVMNIKYTSVNGGGQLATKAQSATQSYLTRAADYAAMSGLALLVDVKSEFASGWSRISQSSSTSTNLSENDAVIELGDLSGRLPIFTRGRDATVKSIRVITDQPIVTGTIGVTSDKDEVPLGNDSMSGASVSVYSSSDSSKFGQKWKIKLGTGKVSLKKCIMIVEYALGQAKGGPR